MEYRKKLTTYSIVLVILVIIGVLGIFFNNQTQTELASQTPLLPGFVPKEATLVQVNNATAGGAAEFLKSNNGTWTLRQGTEIYPANKERLEAFLAGLPKLTEFRRVAKVDPNTPSSLESYGLDKPKSLRIKDKLGKVLVDLQIGKIDDTGHWVYVRFVGKSQVWLTDRNQLAFLEMGANAWTDLHIFPGDLKPSDLVRVSFTGKITTLDKKTYTSYELEKVQKNNKPAWELMPEKTFPSNADGYIDGLPQFNANSYMKADEKFNPATETQGVLTVWTQNGQKIEVHLGAEQKDARVPASQGGRRFWLTSWSLEQILFSNQK
ncbi:MAG: DUF4340 domain-containing protein [Spirochaetales bacterium]|nr:DUF4340 domain-containing protein [Spirochaetales bacterium]